MIISLYLLSYYVQEQFQFIKQSFSLYRTHYDKSNFHTVSSTVTKPLTSNSLTEEYGCCLTSWKSLTNYTSDLSAVLHLYPDKLYKLLEFCEIEPPGGCPYTPDLSKLSTGLVTFLGVAGGVAFIVLTVGIVKNFRET